MAIYTLEALREACRSGQTPDYLFFWGHRALTDGSVDASCFSQWWVSGFLSDGKNYVCAEQFMMAEKARLFGDEDALAKIMLSRDPREMKELGRTVRGFVQEIWEAESYAIAKRGNIAKFAQNPVLGRFLLSTGNRVIVEASPLDRIWGIGMSKHHPDASNPDRWRGLNRLGFALMEARDALRGG